jgi:hypothetical protein
MPVRIDSAQDAALTARAKSLGTTRSEVVRQLIARGLEESPLGRRIGHLEGRLAVAAPKSGWPRTLRERNWRCVLP